MGAVSWQNDSLIGHRGDGSQRIEHGGFVPARQIHPTDGTFKKHVTAEKKVFGGSVVRGTAGSVTGKKETPQNNRANLHGVTILHKCIGGGRSGNATDIVGKTKGRMVKPVGFEFWDGELSVRKEALDIRAPGNMVGMGVGDEYTFQLDTPGLQKLFESWSVPGGVNDGGFVAGDEEIGVGFERAGGQAGYGEAGTFCDYLRCGHFFRYSLMSAASGLGSVPTRPIMARSRSALLTLSEACAPLRMRSAP